MFSQNKKTKQNKQFAILVFVIRAKRKRNNELNEMLLVDLERRSQQKGIFKKKKF